jgi:hypothetical protein
MARTRKRRQHVPKLGVSDREWPDIPPAWTNEPGFDNSRILPSVTWKNPHPRNATLRPVGACPANSPRNRATDTKDLRYARDGDGAVGTTERRDRLWLLNAFAVALLTLSVPQGKPSVMTDI